jgi:hypothetical protein
MADLILIGNVNSLLLFLFDRENIGVEKILGILEIIGMISNRCYYPKEHLLLE